MKYILLGAALAASLGAYAQGPIAHWDFNGTVNDVSGNGHHGHMTNVTPAAGRDGVMGHAYYFNGVNSMVTVPYSTAFNIAKYSICATVKVQGFYSGPCNNNMIFTRGGTSPVGTGNYHLSYTDIATNAGCTLFDSTKELFYSAVGSQSQTVSALDYTPRVAKNVWYRVVATYNDTAFKIYVNGTLKSTSPVGAPGPIPASMDSVSIGYNVFEGSYPYAMNGIIDDIILYDRVLSDSEITKYNTVNVSDIAADESDVNLYPTPATEGINVEIAARQLYSSMMIRICDLSGRSVKEQQLIDGNSRVEIGDIASGVYFADIILDDRILRKKIVKE